MGDTLPWPSWLTMLIVFGMYVSRLYIRSRSSKRGLTKRDIWVSVGEVTGPANALYLLIYVLYHLVSGEQGILSSLLEQPFPIAIICLYLLALLLDFILKNWKAWKRTRKLESD